MMQGVPPGAPPSHYHSSHIQQPLPQTPQQPQQIIPTSQQPVMSAPPTQNGPTEPEP